MTNENPQQEIAIALNQLARMQAYNLIRNDEWKNKPKVEKIIFLHNIGFSPEDIVVVVGTTIGTVKKELSIYKNK